jgi:hypothetical protein
MVATLREHGVVARPAGGLRATRRSTKATWSTACPHGRPPLPSARRPGGNVGGGDVAVLQFFARAAGARRRRRPLRSATTRSRPSSACSNAARSDIPGRPPGPSPRRGRPPSQTTLPPACLRNGVPSRGSRRPRRRRCSATHHVGPTDRAYSTATAYRRRFSLCQDPAVAWSRQCEPARART